MPPELIATYSAHGVLGLTCLLLLFMLREEKKERVDTNRQFIEATKEITASYAAAAASTAALANAVEKLGDKVNALIEKRGR